MELREIFERKRDLKYDTSLWNPLFLHFYFVIKVVKNFFNSLPETELIIYDFGCGMKPYEVFCQNKKYIGVDIDAKNREADILADVSDVPVDDNVADVVVSFFLLEHVPNPQAVINEKYRILKDNGQVFMLIPLYWEEHEQPYDFFRFTRFGIEMMLKKAGFKDIEIKEVNTGASMTGMLLVKLLNRRVIKILIPLINIIFLKLELFVQKRAQVAGYNLSNVMTFSVIGKK